MSDLVRKTIGLSLLLLLMLADAALAGSGTWGERGINRRFAISGDRLYAADGRGVSLYDLRDGAIRRQQVEATRYESNDLALLGTSTLLLATTGGIDRFSVAPDGTLAPVASIGELGDVSRVAASPDFAAAAVDKTLVLFSFAEGDLTETRRLRYPDPIRAVAFVGDSLYVAVERRGVYVVDPGTGNQSAFLPADVQGFALLGDTLYGAGGFDGLYTIDVSTPSHPALTGTTDSALYDLTEVAAAGDRVYAIEPTRTIHPFDVTDRHQPQPLPVLNDWASAIAAGSGRVFVSGPFIDAEHLPYETGLPIRAYDAITLAPAGTYGDGFAGAVTGVATDGTFAYVIDPPYFRVLDVSTTAAPRQVAALVVPDIQDHVRVKNGLAVTYGRGIVNLVDVSNPYHPWLVGVYFTRGHAPSFAALSRDAIIEANRHSGMHLVDFTDPANMAEVSWRKFHYMDVAASDDTIYAVQEQDFVICDISDRTQMIDKSVQMGVYLQVDIAPPNSALPHHLVLRDDHGLHFRNLTANPYQTADEAFVRFENPGIMATADDEVYVARDSIVYRTSVSNPSTPEPAGMEVRAPQQMAAAGGKLVVADRYSVRVFGPDTTSPQPPRRRSSGQ